MSPKFALAWQLAFEGNWPTSVAFVADDLVASGNRDGELYLWRLPDAPQTWPEEAEKASADSPPPVRRLEGHENTITRLIAVGDGRTLISASYDRTIRFWDVTSEAAGTKEVVMDRATREHQARRNRDEDAPDQPGVTVEVQQHQHALGEHREWIRSLSLSGDGKRLISGDDASRVIVWDVASHEPVARWEGHPLNWITSAALSPDGSTAFVGEYRYKRDDFDLPPAQARIYDVQQAEQRLDLLEVQFPDVKQRDNSYGYAQTWRKFTGSGLVAAAFSPDGATVALGQGGEEGPGQVHLVEVATGKLLRSVAGHRYGVTDVRFTADGKYVLSSGRDTSIRISRVDDGEEAAVLGKPRGGQFTDWLHALASSPDGRRIAAADISGKVTVWQQRG
jgi:WD40 repeat protein